MSTSCTVPVQCTTYNVHCTMYMPPFIASVQCQIGAEGRCRMQRAGFIWFLRSDVYLHRQHEYVSASVSVSVSASETRASV